MRRGEIVEVTIARLGHEGDGIAELAGARLFVPFTLPGERWRVRVEGKSYGGARGRPLKRLAPGMPRVAPRCPHFGRCGGCRLQHLPEDAYAAFKLQRIREELARRRLEPERIEPLCRSPLGSRRRLRLRWQPGRRGGRLGFLRLRSHRIEAVTRCPIARPELEQLLAPLAMLLARSGMPDCSVHLACAANGVDVALLTDREGTPRRWEIWSAFAAAHGILRVALGVGLWAEPLVHRAEPWIRVGDLRIPLPPAAFLQATEEGERALAAFVGEAIRDGDRLLDLHAGLGVLTLPHRHRLARLLLVDRDRDAGVAVSRALGAAGAASVRCLERDLEREPMEAAELEGFDLVILDPPRAGARAQCAAIARSRLERLVYVSCNPATFARDARILADAGFRLARLLPIDQFLYSAEIELAAHLIR